MIMVMDGCEQKGCEEGCRCKLCGCILTCRKVKGRYRISLIDPEPRHEQIIAYKHPALMAFAENEDLREALKDFSRQYNKLVEKGAIG